MNNKVVLPKLSYKIMGILFKVHNELGPVQKEKNYQDAVRMLLKRNNIKYEREKEIALNFEDEELRGFYSDFLIENQLILEIKAKNFIKQEDIRQVSWYLKATNLPLGIIANFKRKKLESKRIINPLVADEYKKDNYSGPHLDKIRFIRDGFGKKKGTGKILAIDYGTKNIGLALSDDEQKIAFPYNTLTINKKQLILRQNSGQAKNKIINKIIEDIRNICRIENVGKIIVGLPINLAGEKTKITEKVFEFVKDLEENLDIPVEVEDERLTTVQASRIKDKSSRNLDELSAQILLQGWLDRKNSTAL